MEAQQQQVILNMGYDPSQDMYGFIFEYQGQKQFTITMNLEQVRDHINKVQELVDWSFVVKRDLESSKIVEIDKSYEEKNVG